VRKESTRLPALGPDAIVPTCYDANTGAMRVVAPWSRNGSSASCRPPAPWDSINMPPGGWSKTTCNDGGQFECRTNELFTEVQIRGPQGPQGVPGLQGPQGVQGPRGAQGDRGARGDTGDVGPQGAKGDKGDRGDAGQQGAQGDRGADGPRFVFRGEWKAGASYAANDVVTKDGASFVALRESAGSEPDAAVSSNRDWALFAARGAAGSQGPSGADGLPGAAGAAGATGAQGPAGPSGQGALSVVSTSAAC
jgi:hypothetical protein